MDDALIDTIHAAAGADADTVARANLVRRRTHFNSSNSSSSSSGNSGAGCADTVTFGAQPDRSAGVGGTATPEFRELMQIAQRAAATGLLHPHSLVGIQ